MPTIRSIIAALLALLTGLAVLLAATTAEAGHDRSDTFEFIGAIDEDNDGNAENLAVDIIYDRTLDTHTLDAPAGWVGGDRNGYRCGYAFLRYRGFIVGRVTISKFKDPADPKNAYIELQDKFMHEGSLNFDSTTPTEGNTSTAGEDVPDAGNSCPGAATEAYDPLVGPGEHPSVTFQHGPHAIDVRDFADQLDVDVNDPTIVFDLVSATDTQVVILAYQDNGARPLLSIYYELVADPEQGLAVGEAVPNTMHHVSMHTGCGLECVHSHEPTPDPEPEPTPEPEPDPEPLLGDLDGDGRVNIADLRILTNNWTG